jgi:hypothetical protein
MSAMSDVYVKARFEIIALFGWNVDKLSPDMTLRLDCAVALRLALDDLQGRVVRGEGVDVGKMLTAADALSRLLPPAALAAPPEEANAPDPREIMWQNYLAARRRGELADSYRSPQQRLEAARAKVAEIEAEIAAASLPPDEPGASSDERSSVGGNVVPLRTDDRSSVSPSPPTATPAAPPARTVDVTALPPAEPEPWRNYVLPDGNISPTPFGGAKKFWGPV